MSVSKFNSEGYYDPTTYEALTNIEKDERKARFRPVVYICSPFSGDTARNADNARRYCRFAVDTGHCPYAPHLFLPQFIPFPKCVSEAIAAYKAENDWLGHFLDECCEIGDDLSTKSGELYAAYRAFSASNGEYVRSTTDFYAALEAEGYVRMRTRSGNVISGLKLSPQTTDPKDEFPDFLT